MVAAAPGEIGCVYQACTGGARALAQMGFDAISVPRRHRYFAFRGNKRERAELRAAITGLINLVAILPGKHASQRVELRKAPLVDGCVNPRIDGGRLADAGGCAA